MGDPDVALNHDSVANSFEMKTMTPTEKEGWDERFEKGGPDPVTIKVKPKDPRPKYNILSWLLFL